MMSILASRLAVCRSWTWPFSRAASWISSGSKPGSEYHDGVLQQALGAVFFRYAPHPSNLVWKCRVRILRIFFIPWFCVFIFRYSAYSCRNTKRMGKLHIFLSILHSFLRIFMRIFCIFFAYFIAYFAYFEYFFRLFCILFAFSFAYFMHISLRILNILRIISIFFCVWFAYLA